MPRILIVDDDADIRAMLSRALDSMGQVQQASDGAEALEVLAREEFDVVLLDLHMPNVDGFGVLGSEVARAGPNAETPFFLVTADASDKGRAEALRRRGGLFFLSKPVNLAALRSFVLSALERRANRNVAKGPAPRKTPGRP
jgi:CheY-like chemotaxis protein